MERNRKENETSQRKTKLVTMIEELASKGGKVSSELLAAAASGGAALLLVGVGMVLLLVGTVVVVVLEVLEELLLLPVVVSMLTACVGICACVCVCRGRTCTTASRPSRVYVSYVPPISTTTRPINPHTSAHSALFS